VASAPFGGICAVWWHGIRGILWRRRDHQHRVNRSPFLDSGYWLTRRSVNDGHPTAAAFTVRFLLRSSPFSAGDDLPPELGPIRLQVRGLKNTPLGSGRRAVWPDGVVVEQPVSNLGAGVEEVGEPVVVETLVAKLAVEALDVAVLGGLSGTDEVKLHAPTMGPGVENSAGELRTVVADDELRGAPGRDEILEHSGDTNPSQPGAIDLTFRAPPGAAVSAPSAAPPPTHQKARFVESFQTQAPETADVSLPLETIASYKYPTPQASLRNGIEGADGSIPFSSTTFLKPRTSEAHGRLWGERARAWADFQEGTVRPVFQAVLERTRVGPGSRYLDAGCGSGMSAEMAAARGAKVSGDFRQCDLEELPFADETFDVVTGFNSCSTPGTPLRRCARSDVSPSEAARS
jgi:hypothetical protein